MTKNEANVIMAALLTTIAAAGEIGAPEGPMYAALMGRITLDDFQFLMGVAAELGFIVRDRHVAKATKAGHDIVAKINGLMKTKA